MSRETDGGFAARWSGRKARARLADDPDAPPAAEGVPDTPAAPEPDARSDAEILEALGLPDPDTLGAGSDFRAFMGRAVPAHLRTRALRRLWSSDPVLANLDGLLDHGEDYTDAATVRPDMRTLYRVGKGIVAKVAEIADAPPAVADVPEATRAGYPGDAGKDDAPATQDPDAAAAPPDPASGNGEDSPPDAARPRAERMVFTFDAKAEKIGDV